MDQIVVGCWMCLREEGKGRVCVRENSDFTPQSPQFLVDYIIDVQGGYLSCKAQAWGGK